MGTEYPYSKPKPQRGWSYSVNRTALDAAFEGLDGETIRDIAFVPRPGHVLWAHFVGETSRFSIGAGRVSLHIRTVASADRKTVKRALLEGGLAQLRIWLDQVERAGSTWRATSHTFALDYRDGTLVARET